MFELYNEKARRVIFFARYEASTYGSPYIETEHLLLGILREDKRLTDRFLRSHSARESIRQQIERATIVRERTSTSVDLPLSNECKRVLAYAPEEADRLDQRQIGCEHLFLGLLRETGSFAAKLLAERGLNAEEVRVSLAQTPLEAVVVGSRKPQPRPALTIPVRFVAEDGSALVSTLASIAFVPRIGEQVSLPRKGGYVVANIDWVFAPLAEEDDFEGTPEEGLRLAEVKVTLRPVE